jgi:hypothetical protein
LWIGHVGKGADSAVRFGRAVRQLHPQPQIFATTINSSHSDRCCRRQIDFAFWKKIADGRVANLTPGPTGLDGMAMATGRTTPIAERAEDCADDRGG